MSEIVRPTRDGIHGREYISTAVDLGEEPPFLRLDERGAVVGPTPRVVQRELPFLFDGSSGPGRGPVPDVLARAARVLHLVAGPDGRAGGRFVGDLIRAAHDALVAAGVREEVTLVGGGGIAMAEHVAKAIACGLDAVALDLPLWVALQARNGEDGAPVSFPLLDEAWALQRIRNLANSWRDQLLEVLGAMGKREVRRLRGEVGRIMFQADLEREAFAGVEGFRGG